MLLLRLCLHSGFLRFPGLEASNTRPAGPADVPRRHASPDGLRAEAPAPSSGECRRRPDNLASPEKVLGPSPGPRHPAPGLALAGTLAGPTHTRLSRPSPSPRTGGVSPQAGSCARVPQGSVTCTPARADPGRGQRTPRCRLHAGPTQHHPVLGPWAQALPARHEGALPEQDGALPAGASLCRRDRLPSSAGRRQAACGRDRQQGPGLGWTGASGEAG